MNFNIETFDKLFDRFIYRITIITVTAFTMLVTAHLVLAVLQHII